LSGETQLNKTIPDTTAWLATRPFVSTSKPLGAGNRGWGWVIFFQMIKMLAKTCIMASSPAWFLSIEKAFANGFEY
jgi:hypothetical protein